MYYLAALAFVDKRLDDLQEDYGDLPDQVKELENKLKVHKAHAEETQTILAEIKQFVSTSKITLEELKTKEEKLAKQQFLVRNNKEFDAITKEITHMRDEHSRLSDLVRTEGVKEENLKQILATQLKEIELTEEELKAKIEEYEFVESDQNEEVKMLTKKRNAITKHIEKPTMVEYERIRVVIKDAVVKANRNSCSGCFSAIPPQKMVEIRNSIDTLYFCENCGRILYPEEINISEEKLSELK